MDIFILVLIAILIIVILAVINKYQCKHDYQIVYSFKMTWMKRDREHKGTLYCTRCKICGDKQVDGDMDVLDEGRAGIVNRWKEGTVSDDILKSIGE